MDILSVIQKYILNSKASHTDINIFKQIETLLLNMHQALVSVQLPHHIIDKSISTIAFCPWKPSFFLIITAS
jgi:hypothetical protein